MTSKERSIGRTRIFVNYFIKYIDTFPTGGCTQLIHKDNTPKGLFGCMQIHPNPHGLEGIEVERKLNFTSIPLKPRGLGWICVQPNKA
jgi:hypothetical protein